MALPPITCPSVRHADRIRAAIAADLKSPTASSRGTGAALLYDSMEPVLRILAVDNEPSVTTSLTFIFTAPRYRLVAVKSGDEALAKLEADANQFDVIIVDQKMPHLTGVELVSAIRERSIKSKIIILSAHLSPEVREAYRAMDVHVMFDKPFDITELRAAVESLAA